MKRLLSLVLCVAMAFALPITAIGADYVSAFSEKKVVDWYGDTTDDERIYMAWELLHVFRYAGYPVGSMAANDFAQAMNDYYDLFGIDTVWEVALSVLKQKLVVLGERQFLARNGESYYRELYERDWYGDTTDDVRIAMAEDLLNYLRSLGVPVGALSGAELAQMMNDYYDQDKRLSVWEVAEAVLEPVLPALDDLVMPDDYDAEIAEAYLTFFEPDWYGAMTDADRIDVAWDLLNVLQKSGYAFGHIGANDFAQAMNDLYDQDKSLPIWEVALIALDSTHP